MIKLSKTKKMPCKSWSLQAGLPKHGGTCPGAGDHTRPSGYVAACEDCYALTGAYQWPAAVNARQRNLDQWLAWTVDVWVAAMVAAIGKSTHCRWFDSGDSLSPQMTAAIYRVVMLTPDCQHWWPTKTLKLAKHRDIHGTFGDLPNVVVRQSGDSLGATTACKWRWHSTIVPAEDVPAVDAHRCPADQQGGTCGDCRACWDRSIPVIEYPHRHAGKATAARHAAKHSEVIARG